MLLARATWCAALVTASLFLLLIGAATAAVPVKDHGPLSPALAQLAKPAVRALPPAKEARALGVAPSGPGSLIRRGNRVLVYVRHQPGAGTLPALRDEGARIVANSRPLRTVTAAVSPSGLRAIARAPGVLAVTQVRAPVLRAACDGGSVISEGVAQMNVAAAREEFEVEGEEIEIGVLSDSFDQATDAVPGGPIATTEEDDEESGDLPGPGSPCATQKKLVDELQDYEFFEEEESFDEGRGMLQIVHDVAPEADLAFHSAFNGELDFAEGIEDLAAAGADVIVDDVGYFEEPFFQEGPVALAATTVSEGGSTYLSSAGNDNLFDGEGNEISSWEAPAFRDSGDCPPEIRSLSTFNATHCLDFDPSGTTDRTFGIAVEAEETLTVDLQWAEPWFGVENDLDVFLLNAEGELLTTSFEDNIEETGRPVEILQWENPTGADRVVQLVVNHFAGTGEPRLKFALLQNGGGVSGIEYPKSGGGDVVGPTVYGHAAAASAIAVAAVPFDDSGKPEEYSSRGPATHYFGPVEGETPAPELLEPEVVSKPNVAATDCGRTTFFARQPISEPGVWRFCGTSAAAPHAAGVLALMQEAAPTQGPELLGSTLAGTAVPVGEFGPCAVGGGLIEALAAVKAADEEAVVPGPEPCEPPDASGAVFVAPGDWGSESPPEPPDKPVTPPEPPRPPLPPEPRVAPSTAIARHPRAIVRTRGSGIRLVFRFSTDQADAGFLCNIDKAGFRPCGATLARRWKPGRHLLKVKARGATGLVDPTPAIFRFRVIAVASPSAR